MILDKYDNDSNDTFLLFKPKILNAIKFIRDRKKLADLEATFDRLRWKPPMPIQLVNCKLTINKKTHTGFDSFH